MDDETIKLIMGRLDIIEDKLTKLDGDPFKLNDYFRLKNNQIPDGYTLVDSIGTD